MKDESRRTSRFWPKNEPDPGLKSPDKTIGEASGDLTVAVVQRSGRRSKGLSTRACKEQGTGAGRSLDLLPNRWPNDLLPGADGHRRRFEPVCQQKIFTEHMLNLTVIVVVCTIRLPSLQHMLGVANCLQAFLQVIGLDAALHLNTQNRNVILFIV